MKIIYGSRQDHNGLILTVLFGIETTLCHEMTGTGDALLHSDLNGPLLHLEQLDEKQTSSLEIGFFLSRTTCTVQRPGKTCQGVVSSTGGLPVPSSSFLEHAGLLVVVYWCQSGSKSCTVLQVQESGELRPQHKCATAVLKPARRRTRARPAAVLVTVLVALVIGKE